MGILHAVEQNTQPWTDLRCGALTASTMGDLMSRTKTGWGASHHALIARKVVEKLTGKIAETYQSEEMKWGIIQEPNARSLFSFLYEEAVPTGIWEHSDIPGFLASPDALVGQDAILEIKAPTSHVHINEHLLEGKVKQAYFLQVQAQLCCTGRSLAYFASYDPRLPEEMQLWVQKIPRCEKTISEMLDVVQVALVEIDNKVSELRSKYRSNSHETGKGIRSSSEGNSRTNDSRESAISASP